MKSVLLDTDTVSYFFKGIPSVKERVAQYLKTGQKLNISVITYYEICNGLYYRDAQKQLARFKEFASYCNIIPLIPEVADTAAGIFSDLRKSGKTVGHTDILIAGTAIYHELQLITNNVKHYKDVANLDLNNWIASF